MHIVTPPSLHATRGARALEVGTYRIDSLLARLPQATPARISLDVSNVSQMFQQALTIATYHLPTAPITGAIAQAMAGMDQLTRRFHKGDPMQVAEVRTRLDAWRVTAQDGIAALYAVKDPTPFAAPAA